MKQVTVSYVLNPLFARNQTISVNSKNFKEHVTKGKERLLKNQYFCICPSNCISILYFVTSKTKNIFFKSVKIILIYSMKNKFIKKNCETHIHTHSHILTHIHTEWHIHSHSLTQWHTHRHTHIYTYTMTQTTRETKYLNSYLKNYK